MTDINKTVIQWRPSIDNLATTERVLPAYLHKEDIYLVNSDSCFLEDLETLIHYFAKLLQLQFETTCFYVYGQMTIGSICLDLISYYYFQNIQSLVNCHDTVYFVKTCGTLAPPKILVSSLKLRISVDLLRCSISLKELIIRRGSKKDSWGTPCINSSH